VVFNFVSNTILIWHRVNFWTCQGGQETLKEVSEITCYIIFSNPLQSCNVLYWDILWSDLSIVSKIFYACKSDKYEDSGDFCGHI
jgi:hypothetical protein